MAPESNCVASVQACREESPIPGGSEPSSIQAIQSKLQKIINIQNILYCKLYNIITGISYMLLKKPPDQLFDSLGYMLQMTGWRCPRPQLCRSLFCRAGGSGVTTCANSSLPVINSSIMPGIGWKNMEKQHVIHVTICKTSTMVKIQNSTKFKQKNAQNHKAHEQNPQIMVKPCRNRFVFSFAIFCGLTSPVLKAWRSRTGTRTGRKQSFKPKPRVALGRPHLGPNME